MSPLKRGSEERIHDDGRQGQHLERDLRGEFPQELTRGLPLPNGRGILATLYLSKMITVQRSSLRVGAPAVTNVLAGIQEPPHSPHQNGFFACTNRRCYLRTFILARLWIFKAFERPGMLSCDRARRGYSSCNNTFLSQARWAIWDARQIQ